MKAIENHKSKKRKKKEKRILRCFQGTIQFGIHHSSRGTPLLVVFIDSNWANDPYDQNSTTGYVFILGFVLVTWACKKQKQ
jgi:hypothetical protein